MDIKMKIQFPIPPGGYNSTWGFVILGMVFLLASLLFLLPGRQHIMLIILGPLTLILFCVAVVEFIMARYMYERISTPSRVAMDFYTMGNERLQRQEPDKALELFEKALGIDPFFAAAYNSAGICHLLLGDKVGGLACLNKALEIAPQYPDAVANLMRVRSGIEPGDSGEIIPNHEIRNSAQTEYLLAQLGFHANQSDLIPANYPNRDKLLEIEQNLPSQQKMAFNTTKRKITNRALEELLQNGLNASQCMALGKDWHAEGLDGFVTRILPDDSDFGYSQCTLAFVCNTLPMFQGTWRSSFFGHMERVCGGVLSGTTPGMRKKAASLVAHALLLQSCITVVAMHFLDINPVARGMVLEAWKGIDPRIGDIVLEILRKYFLGKGQQA